MYYDDLIVRTCAKIYAIIETSVNIIERFYGLLNKSRRHQRCTIYTLILTYVDYYLNFK